MASLLRGRLPFRSSRISYHKAVMQKAITRSRVWHVTKDRIFGTLSKKTDRSWEVYLNIHNSATSITNTMQMFDENAVDFMATRSWTFKRTCTHVTTVFRRTGSASWSATLKLWKLLFKGCQQSALWSKNWQHGYCSNDIFSAQPFRRSVHSNVSVMWFRRSVHPFLQSSAVPSSAVASSAVVSTAVPSSAAASGPP